MQALILPARRGWRWLAAGFALFRRNPPLFTLLVMGYWLVLALVNSVPLLGGVVSYLAMPALSMVLMNACRVLDRRLAVTPSALIAGLRGYAPTLVVLGGVYFTATLAILGISSLIDGGTLFNLMFTGAQISDDALEAREFLLATQVALILLVPLVMAYWFAPILVVWHGATPGKALFFSFVACLRNWRAFLVYSLSLALWSALLPGLVLGFVAAIFPGSASFMAAVLTAPLLLVLAPTVVASFYVGYRDILAEGDGAAP